MLSGITMECDQCGIFISGPQSSNVIGCQTEVGPTAIGTYINLRTIHKLKLWLQKIKQCKKRNQMSKVWHKIRSLLASKDDANKDV